MAFVIPSAYAIHGESSQRTSALSGSFSGIWASRDGGPEKTLTQSPRQEPRALVVATKRGSFTSVRSCLRLRTCDDSSFLSRPSIPTRLWTPTFRRSNVSTFTTEASLGNTFGHVFRITTYGESHGGGVGVIVDGCPPMLNISVEEIQAELDRRRPGQSRIVTPRKEEDAVEILSGVSDGVTTGTPISMLVRNKDQRSQDYSDMAVKYRPSHADATYDMKYGVRSVAGGGRSSARETIGRVAAGAIAKKILKEVAGVEIIGYVEKVQDIRADIDTANVTLEQVESNIVRCPNSDTAEKMIALIDEIRKRGNSIGGVVGCVARNVPAGLGSPAFDKLEADLAKALMSLPASKGFEVGSGFEGTLLTGSEHNDEFYLDEHGRIRTRTNRSGGIQGGISNGEDIIVRVAFKPTSTIGIEQRTVSADGAETTIRAKGRHDPCVLPRAVPMVESMVALVLCDHLLRQAAQCHVLSDRSFHQVSVIGKSSNDVAPEQASLLAPSTLS